MSGRHDSEAGVVTDARPGRWAGDLAARLGVSDELKYGQLMAVLEQRHPVTGEQLGRRSQTASASARTGGVRRCRRAPAGTRSSRR